MSSPLVDGKAADRKKRKKKKKKDSNAPPYKHWHVVASCDGGKTYEFRRKVTQYDVLLATDKDSKNDGYDYSRAPGNQKLNKLVEISLKEMETASYYEQPEVLQETSGSDSEDDPGRYDLAENVVYTIRDQWNGYFLRKIEVNDPTLWVDVGRLESTEEVLEAFDEYTSKKKSTADNYSPVVANASFEDACADRNVRMANDTQQAASYRPNGAAAALARTGSASYFNSSEGTTLQNTCKIGATDNNAAGNNLAAHDGAVGYKHRLTDKDAAILENGAALTNKAMNNDPLGARATGNVSDNGLAATKAADSCTVKTNIPTTHDNSTINIADINKTNGANIGPVPQDGTCDQVAQGDDTTNDLTKDKVLPRSNPIDTTGLDNQHDNTSVHAAVPISTSAAAVGNDNATARAPGNIPSNCAGRDNTVAGNVGLRTFAGVGHNDDIAHRDDLRVDNNIAVAHDANKESIAVVPQVSAPHEAVPTTNHRHTTKRVDKSGGTTAETPIGAVHRTGLPLSGHPSGVGNKRGHPSEEAIPELPPQKRQRRRGRPPKNNGENNKVRNKQTVLLGPRDTSTLVHLPRRPDLPGQILYGAMINQNRPEFQVKPNEKKLQQQNEKDISSSVRFITRPRSTSPFPMSPPEKKDETSSLVEQARAYLHDTDPKWLNYYDMVRYVRVTLYRNGSMSKWSTGTLRLQNAKKADMRLSSWIAEQRKLYQDYCAWEETVLESLNSEKAGKIGPEGNKEEEMLREIQRAKIVLLDDIRFVYQPDQEPPDDAPDDWKESFFDLREYVKTRGDTAVPDTVELGFWAQLQRMRFQRSLLVMKERPPVSLAPQGAVEPECKFIHTTLPLSRGQMLALRGLGFDFDDLDSSCFYAMYMKLLEFKNRVGDCLVPLPSSENIQFSDDEDENDEGKKKDDSDSDQEESDQTVDDYADLRLSFWVQRMRAEYIKFLHAKEIAGRHKAESKASAKGEGGARGIVEGHLTGKDDSQMVHSRQDSDNATANHLKDKSRSQKAFSTGDDRINQKMEALKRDAKDFGQKGKVHENEQESASGKIETGGSSKRQEEKSKHIVPFLDIASTLTQSHVELLNACGFIWSLDIRDNWRRQYRRLQAFYIKNGHSKVTKTTNEAKTNLNRWVSQMRTSYQKRDKGGPFGLSKEKIDLLDKLGFVFVLNEAAERKSFYQNFELLKQYNEKHGNCDVPQKHPTLGNFVKNCRKEYESNLNKKRTMDPEKIRSLESIGFNFRIREICGSRRRTQSLPLRTRVSDHAKDLHDQDNGAREEKKEEDDKDDDATDED